MKVAGFILALAISTLVDTNQAAASVQEVFVGGAGVVGHAFVEAADVVGLADPFAGATSLEKALAIRAVQEADLSTGFVEANGFVVAVPGDLAAVADRAVAVGIVVKAAVGGDVGLIDSPTPVFRDGKV